MKVQFLIPVALLVSVALVGVIKIRQNEQDKEEKRSKFLEIKLRVTYDVLGEYQSDTAETETKLEKTQTEMKALIEEANMAQAKADKAKGEVDVCQGGQKLVKDGLGSLETEINNLKAEHDKEKTSWATQVETQKQQLAARSAVCDFLKAESHIAGNLCGVIEAPKPEAPKPEAPKPEAPKPEEPKPEAEAPKPEAPKPEAPKKR
ncbi:hypothetical protein EPR50_G00064670 [Perca flavescens]|uniref:Uncharacterized protein n=1 Tax=Perca flavescens TaxID=8167 RepID=A0A484D8Y1_PERFV|nr:neurofilament medium polypeptide-like [Perca flavescens]XP_028436438.1 neurofilament medium polypeptide-like [Perca flavescens]TDH11791.1 hypothetical protein EPR50_G00064670 [Perca flavescens]